MSTQDILMAWAVGLGISFVIYLALFLIVAAVWKRETRR